MVLKDIKIFEKFWQNKEKNFTPRNWAISAFHLGMEVQAQKEKLCNKVDTIDSNKELCLCPEYFGDCEYCSNGECRSPLV